MKDDTPSVDDVIVMSSSPENFFENLKLHISLSTIKQIELLTHGQSENSLWYDFRKCVVTASIAHDAQTKVAKLEKDMTPDFWSLFQKVCGNAFVSPNIPALKYGREMEPIAATKFIDIFSKTHKNVKVDTCGLYLHSSFPFIGASPDGIVHYMKPRIGVLF